MNKYIFLLALLLLPLASATIGYDDISYGVNYIPPVPPINYSLIDTNNSQYLQGYTPTTLRTWMEDHFDLIYAPLTSLADYWKRDGTSTATGDWDLGSYDLTATEINTDDIFLSNGNITFNGTDNIWDFS